MSRRKARPDPFMAPAESARSAALVHQSDDRPGISRRKSGPGFSYRDAESRTIRDRATLSRIKALAIPPAWTQVWISPSINGHLQATGRDARGRKQFRYHPKWRKARDTTKYGRMISFGHALPRIRERVQADLAQTGIPREKVLALLVQLLESTFIRIGNEEYARTNRSYGLTTLQNRHVSIEGSQVQFRFRGKSGKVHSIARRDRRLARLVQQCRDLPGQDLFQYLDEAGEPHPIGSLEVNEYIREISGEEFTAKDFRTWAGTVLAVRELGAQPASEVPPGHAALLLAIIEVSCQLGNTPAVCRSSYIHPALLGAFEDARLFGLWSAAVKSGDPPDGLSAEEGAVLHFLESAEGAPRVVESG